VTITKTLKGGDHEGEFYINEPLLFIKQFIGGIMMKNGKVYSLIFSLIFVFMLAACGGGGEGASSEATEGSSGGKKVIGVSPL
jgi:hypothetical protein